MTLQLSVVDFFPNRPRTVGLEIQGFSLAFKSSVQEMLFLKERTPGMAMSAVMLIYTVAVPPVLMVLYERRYTQAAEGGTPLTLPLMSRTGLILAYIWLLLSCAAHVAARVLLVWRFGDKGHLYLQKVSCVLVMMVGLLISAVEYWENPEWQYQGYLHVLLWWYLLLCYAARIIVFRYAAFCSMLSVTLYCFCAAAASFMRWPMTKVIAQSVAAVAAAVLVNASNASSSNADTYNASGVNATLAPTMSPKLETVEAVLGPRPWYHASVQDKHTPDMAATAISCTLLGLMYLVAYTLAYRSEQSERNAYVASVAVHSHYESDRDEENRLTALVKEVIPRPIVPELKAASGGTHLQMHPQATVLVADLAGFLAFSDTASPEAAVTFLNKLFSEFDAVARRHGCIKIKSCASRYILAAGLPNPRPDHAEAAAECALEMLAKSEECLQEWAKGEQYARRMASTAEDSKAKLRGLESGLSTALSTATGASPRARALAALGGGSTPRQKVEEELQPKVHSVFRGLRVGLHSGPLVAGILGRGPLLYDIWGETASVAARMELCAPPGTVLVSSTTESIINKQFETKRSGMVNIKGKGGVLTYMLLARKYSLTYAANTRTQHAMLPGAASKMASMHPDNISQAVREQCAYPAHPDWGFLTPTEPAKLHSFRKGLRAFGTTFPFPRFRRFRQPQWEHKFRLLEGERNLWHHQIVLCCMVVIIAAAEWATQTFVPCKPELVDLKSWLEYSSLLLPYIALVLFIVFLPRIYLKHSHPILCLLMPAITCAYAAFGSLKAPYQPADIGWYGTVSVQIYIYFGGYMVWPFAVPSSALCLVTTYIWIEYGPRMSERAVPRWDIFEINLVVIVCGLALFGRFSHARRLYFGWWTYLRDYNHDKGLEIGDPGRAETLLLMMLPVPVTQRVFQERKVIADEYADAAILQLDIVGITRLCSPPPMGGSGMGGDKMELGVGACNDFLTIITKLAEKYEVTFIKTSGATVLLGAGMPTPRKRYVEALVQLALDVIDYVDEFTRRRFAKIARVENVHPSLGIGVRAGIAMGRVSAGLVGYHRFAYDVWGATSNRAARLESHAGRNCVQVDRRCAEALQFSKFARIFKIGPPAAINMGGVEIVNAFQVERSGDQILVAPAPPDEVRFWREHELEAELFIVDMMLDSEWHAMSEYYSEYSLDHMGKLNKRQNKQMQAREICAKELAHEIRHGNEGRAERLKPIRKELCLMIEEEVDLLRTQHTMEQELAETKLDELRVQMRALHEQHCVQLRAGEWMSGTLHVLSAAGLARLDTFGHCDPYVVVLWNGEEVGRTQIVSHSKTPVFKHKVPLSWFNQHDSELVLRIYDHNLGDEEDHEFLGMVTLKGRSSQMLKESEDEFKLQCDPDPAVSDKHVGGIVFIKFSPDRSILKWDGTRRPDRKKEARLLRAAATARNKEDSGGGDRVSRKRIMAIYDEDADGHVTATSDEPKVLQVMTLRLAAQRHLVDFAATAASKFVAEHRASLKALLASYDVARVQKEGQLQKLKHGTTDLRMRHIVLQEDDKGRTLIYYQLKGKARTLGTIPLDGTRVQIGRHKQLRGEPLPTFTIIALQRFTFEGLHYYEEELYTFAAESVEERDAWVEALDVPGDDGTIPPLEKDHDNKAPLTDEDKKSLRAMRARGMQVEDMSEEEEEPEPEPEPDPELLEALEKKAALRQDADSEIESIRKQAEEEMAEFRKQAEMKMELLRNKPHTPATAEMRSRLNTAESRARARATLDSAGGGMAVEDMGPVDEFPPAPPGAGLGGPWGELSRPGTAQTTGSGELSRPNTAGLGSRPGTAASQGLLSRPTTANNPESAFAPRPSTAGSVTWAPPGSLSRPTTAASRPTTAAEDPTEEGSWPAVAEELPWPAMAEPDVPEQPEPEPEPEPELELEMSAETSAEPLGAGPEPSLSQTTPPSVRADAALP